MYIQTAKANVVGVILHDKVREISSDMPCSIDSLCMVAHSLCSLLSHLIGGAGG